MEKKNDSKQSYKQKTFSLRSLPPTESCQGVVTRSIKKMRDRLFMVRLSNVCLW